MLKYGIKTISLVLSALLAVSLFAQCVFTAGAGDADDELELTSFSYSNGGYTTYTLNETQMLWTLTTKKAPGTSVSCTGVQGLNVGKNYIYSVKTDSENRYAVFDRINANTGDMSVMDYYASESATTPTACNTVWHANDLFVGSVNDESFLLAATTESSPGITRMKISGNGLYFTGFFDLVSPSGSLISAGGISCITHSGGYFYMLIKHGVSFYIAKIPDSAKGGTKAAPTQIPCVKIFQIDTKNVIMAKSNSSYGTPGNMEVWVSQGFGYNAQEKAIYVPMFNGNENIGENIIICYDVKNYVTKDYMDALTKDQSPKLFPSRTSFHIEDSTAGKFEIENCGFRTSQGTDGDLYLYFNTNSDTASKEGVGRILYKSGTATHDSIVDENSIIYTVAYNGNGGTVPDDTASYYKMNSTTHVYGVSNNLRPNSFAKDGCTFAGWYLTRKSDGKWLYFCKEGARWYTKGEQPTGAYLALYGDRRAVGKLTSVNGDTITCYAQWTPNSTGTKTFYLQYDANGGTGTMAQQTAVYGNTTYLAANTFVKTGYTFLGWAAHRRSDNAFAYIDSTSADYTASWLDVDHIEEKNYLKTYTDGCSVLKAGAVDRDIVTLYAVWGKSSGNAPTNLALGEKFAFRGTVSAVMPSLYSVTAQIKDSAGKTVKTVTSVLNGASYDLSNANAALDTSVLAIGNYTYEVSVKVVNTSSTIKTYTLQSSAFTVSKTFTAITGALDVGINAPSYGAAPSAASGVSAAANCSCKSIAWTPSVSSFAAGTVYSAAVVLKANDGYGFTDGITVNVAGAAAVNGLAISNYGEELSFTVVFPETQSLALTDSAENSGKYSLKDGLFTGITEKMTLSDVNKLFKYDISTDAAGYIGTGKKISCAGTTVTVVLKADLDGDGAVTVNDYQAIKASLKAAEFRLSGEYAAAADVNADGRYTVCDYIMIKRHVGGTYNVYNS